VRFGPIHSITATNFVADLPSPSTEGFSAQDRAFDSNSDHGFSTQMGNSQINASGPHFHQPQSVQSDWVLPNHSIPQDSHLNGSIDPALISNRVHPSPVHNYGYTSRASMPVPDATQRIVLPQRSHFSPPLPFGNRLTGGSSASSSNNGLLRQAVHSGIGDMNRDSVASSRSFASLDSESSANSEYTSASSVGGQSTPGSSRPSSGATSPFNQAVLPLPRGRRSTSSSNKSSNAQSRIIRCRFPPCSVTFSREDTRNRHEKQKHDPKVATYTCLLDTCNMSCKYDCQIPYHKSPFQDTRIDKMKAHLDKNHNWGLTQADIPDYWTKSYEHYKWGWKCCDCSTDLGSWEFDPRFFAEHFKRCGVALDGQEDATEQGQGQVASDNATGLRLENLMKRLSTEGQETERGLVDMRISTDKALPPRPKGPEITEEDEEYWKLVCDTWQN
jgi:hypothetical protein